jgi:serine/threonine protein kinase/tetratricopeptide (TPR) repeat protein
MGSPGVIGSVRLQKEPPPCAQCGATSQVGRGLCLKCLLYRGLGEETYDNETLESVLEEVDVRDADWRLGNYQILEEIGRGGMGVIYRARQRHSRRIVALKRILAFHSDSRETLVRFRREAEAAASLDHPNILPIYEVGESDDGLPYFSMKLATGGSLQESQVALHKDPRRSVALMAKVSRAVQYAHTHGILHRDLKPGNILLDGRGEPLVSDFGLAKWLDTTSDLTRTLTVFGTPGYIAPEQANGPAASLKPTADIYSLGAILFDLLAGRPPFLGEHALSVIQQAADKPAPKLRALRPKLDRDLETICARCLEREPSARYSSAGDLAEDLERWLEGRPIIARPISAPIRVWRWSKRNPKLAGSIAAFLLASAVAIVWQTQSRHLAATVRRQQVEAHSITVLPFLDLDSISADAATTKIVATALQSQISQFGPSNVVIEAQPTVKWTGTGILEEVQEATRSSKTRAAICGTLRTIQGKTRVSLRLVSANGTDVLGKWILTTDKQSELGRSAITSEIGLRIYNALDGKTKVASELESDSTFQDETARGYFNAGRSLLDRRTVVDMDRAIACFESAIKAAPQSVAARSYLAMAYMGRNYLISSPKTIDRAYQTAREAIALAPEDPTANRGLCYVAEARGHYAEALEYGLHTIELGDQSERALGEVAYAWKMLGRPDKAILWYKKAKISNQQPADYDALLGDCFADLALDEQARAAYETAAAFRPDLPEGWIGLVYLRLITGDLNGAQKLLDARSQEYASFPVAKQLQALVAFFGRNYSEAERFYQQLLIDDPAGIATQHYGAVSYSSALARLKRAQNDPTQATKLASACLESDLKQLAESEKPSSAEILYRLAADEAILQNQSAATKYLNESIANGWLDYRSPKLDPRFDSLHDNFEFKKTLDDLATRVADLKRQQPAVKLAQQ